MPALRALAFLAYVAVMLASVSSAQADFTVSACGSNHNEGVFSAVLPPGGSVTDER